VVWHLEPSLTDPDLRSTPGSRTRRSSAPPDGGQSWHELSGLRHPHLRAVLAAGRGRDVPAHDPPRPEPARPDLRRDLRGGRVPERRRRRDVAADQPRAYGRRGSRIRTPYGVALAYHRIAMHRSRPGVLFMQKHWDVMRSDDAGDSWREVEWRPAERLRVPDRRARPRAGRPSTWCPSRATSEHYPARRQDAGLPQPDRRARVGGR